MQDRNLKKMCEFEGCHLSAYIDPVGVPTIGYGHTAGVKMGQTITQAQAVEFLKKDIQTAERAVDALRLSINENQRDALASFCYNCGANNLKKLTTGRTLAQIADAIPLYNKGGGKVLLGLVRRRAWEKELFLTPTTGNAGAAKTEAEIAQEVIDGKWGNGAERRQRLEAAGWNYASIQAKVNALLKKK